MRSLFLLVLIATGCASRVSPPVAASSALPLNPAVTQETIDDTICVPGWTAKVRPPEIWTAAVKRDRLANLPPSADHDPTHYELDHQISLALGGAPADPRNLQLQPIAEARRWDVDLEVPLSRAVCDRLIPLADAQRFEWEHK